MLIFVSNSPSHPRALAPGLLSGVRGFKLVALRYVLAYQDWPAIRWNPAAEQVVVNRKVMAVSSKASQLRRGTPPYKRPYQDFYSSCQVHHNVF